MEHTDFPDSETLAAFIDGRLDAETRKKVTAHVADCDECYATLEAARGWGKADDAAPAAVSRAGRRALPWFLATAAAVLVAAVLTVASGDAVQTWIYEQRLGIRGVVVAANEAELRPSNARLSGSFDYRRASRVFRGTSDAPENYHLSAAAGDIQERERMHDDAATLHAMGVAQFELGKFEDAVTSMEFAARRQTGAADPLSAIHQLKDARLASDLAAAYEAHAEYKGDPHALVNALEAASRAVALTHGRSKEAVWNRALILEKVGLTAEARAAWLEYIQLDPSSRWTAEARDHLRTLADAAAARVSKTWRAALTSDDVSEHAQELRSYVEDELLPRGDANALRVARLLAQRTDDQVLVASAESASRGGAPEGFRLYRSGRTAYDNGDFAAARDAFTRARDVLRASGNPFHFIAAQQRLRCVCTMEGATPCLAEVAKLRKQLAASGMHDVSLNARLDWAEGWARSTEGGLVEASDAYRRALAGFSSAGEEENVAAVHALLGSTLSGAGEAEQGFAHFVAALRSSDTIRSIARRHNLLIDTAVFFIQQNATTSAVAVLDAAGETSQADDRMAIDLLRGVAELRQNDAAAARIHINSARRLLALIRDRSTRQQMESFVTLAEIGVRRLSPVRDSEPDLDRALAEYRRRDNAVWVPELLYERGQIRERKGDPAAAERDYLEAARWLSERQPRLDQTLFGISFSSDAIAPFRAAVRLLAQRGDAVDALMVADRVHALEASVLLGRDEGVQNAFGAATRRFVDARTLEELRTRLDERTVVLELFVDGETLYTWFISRDGVALDRRVTSDPRSKNAAQVATVWINATLPRVAADATIVIVPPAELRATPFSAIVMSDGQPLVTSHATAVAPSLAALTASVRRDETLAAAPRVLFVAVPEAEGQPFLRYAADEAERCAAFYATRSVLAASSASRDHFLESAAAATLIHYAGHSVVNERRPLDSALTFADSTLLRVRDMTGAMFPRAELIVLDSCSTALSAKPSTSILDALLLQGVPSVVGTLWPVDDRAGSEFSLLLHRELAAGASRATAVRAAQLALLHGSDPQFRSSQIWAAFELAGAVRPVRTRR